MKRDREMYSFKELRALAYDFGDDNSSSLRRAFLFFTLYFQYTSALYKDRETIERHNGFIVRTLKDLSVLTGTPKRTLREDLAFLEGRYLITYRKGMGIRFKVNLEYFSEFIILATDTYDIYKERQFKESEKTHEDFIENLKQRSNEMSRIITEMNPYDFNSLVESFGKKRMSYVWLVYLFSHYYRRYTGLDYEWSAVRLNTMKKVWKEGFYKRYPEFGLSRAIKAALEDKSKRPFALVWRENFKADFNTDPFTGQPITDVLDDGLLRRF